MFSHKFPWFFPSSAVSWRRVPRCGAPGTAKAQAAEEQQQPRDQPGDGPGETRQKVEGRGARTRGRHDDVPPGSKGSTDGIFAQF